MYIYIYITLLCSYTSDDLVETLFFLVVSSISTISWFIYSNNTHLRVLICDDFHIFVYNEDFMSLIGSAT